MQRGVDAPAPRQGEHPRGKVQALQPPRQGRQRDAGQPGAAAEVEANVLPGRRPRFPQRRREQFRRPVVELLGQFRVEPLREAVEQVAHVLRRRPRRDGGAAERGEQETRLRRQGGTRFGAREGGFGGRGGAFGVAGLAPGVGQRQPGLGRVGGQRGRPLQRLHRRPRVAQGRQGLA